MNVSCVIPTRDRRDMVGRRAFERIQGFLDNKNLIGEDWLFFLRLADKYHFGFAEREIALRRLHKGSLCSIINAAGILQALQFIGNHLQRTDINHNNASIHDRFSDIATWVKLYGKEWSTVQQWYLSMKDGGLI